MTHFVAVLPCLIARTGEMFPILRAEFADPGDPAGAAFVAACVALGKGKSIARFARGDRE